ncbi:hypothetical protein R1flu_003894 [Riccia fluitans]|uniref:C2 domain-containing protein n=1 Tax=Riccia fluitans TaxID=41844 RepID=A0ABD1YDX5_9MARC
MLASMDRAIEVTIISASHLKKIKTLGHQRSYVVAYIYENHKVSSKVDSDGGLNPNWNFRLTLDCDESLFVHHGTYLNFEIYNQGYFSEVLSDTLIGSVAVPLRDLEKDVRCHVEAARMSFQVRRPSGKEKGVLNVAIKLGDRRDRKDEGHLPFHAPQYEYRRIE